jgi:peptidoglycan hydrolase CwlO-like protein
MPGVDQEARTDIATLKANLANVEGWLKSAVSRIETQIEKLLDKLDKTCPQHQLQIQVLQSENTNLKSELNEIKGKLSDYDDIRSRVKLLTWIVSIVAGTVITAITMAVMRIPPK